MKLYFVRHGETNANVNKTVVSPKDELTNKGVEQANAIAKYFSKIPIDTILASPHKRALRTAEIIAKQLNKKFTANDLLKERKWPSEFEGRPMKNPEVEKFLKLLIQKTQKDLEWHHSDEESFLDTKKRASQFLEYVSDLKVDSVLAVSHEYFIKMVLAFMMNGEKLSYDSFRDFFFFTVLDNTSMTFCQKEEGQWRLVTLNDKHS